VGQRPVNRFSGPDPTTFASSALWDPVIPAGDGVNRWLPAAPSAPLGSPATAGEDERPRDEPVEPHDQSVERTQEVVPERVEPDGRRVDDSVERTQEVVAERVEPDGRRVDDEDEFCWPEFDESSTVAFRPPDEPEPGVEPDQDEPGQHDGAEHSDASRDDSSPDRRDDHERSHEPAAGS
jgi:hypothetical protein